MITQENITLEQRLKGPTPKFWKTVRKVSLALTALTGIMALTPIGPVFAVVAQAVAAVTAGIGTASFAAVDFDKLNEQQNELPQLTEV